MILVLFAKACVGNIICSSDLGILLLVTVAIPTLFLVVAALIKRNEDAIENNYNTDNSDATNSSEKKSKIPKNQQALISEHKNAKKGNFDGFGDSFSSYIFLALGSLLFISLIAILLMWEARSPIIKLAYRNLESFVTILISGLIGKFLIFGFVCIVGWYIAGATRRSIVKKGAAKELHQFSAYKIYAYAADIIIKIITIVIGLACLGLNVSVLIASLGIGGFAIGFATKDILANILAGIMIVAYRPFKIGDTITVSGCTGEVSDMNIRYTELSTETEVQKIPNSIVYSSVLNIKKTEQTPAEVSENSKENISDQPGDQKFKDDTGC